MDVKLINGNVRAHCPDCSGVVTTFENRGGSDVDVSGDHFFGNHAYDFVRYRLFRCAGCGRGGMAKIHVDRAGNTALESFLPTSIEQLSLPGVSIPKGIVTEFREAELCFSVSAYRASSALFRSTLEKVLKVNGYTEGDLYGKINKAIEDGVITATRGKRAHDDVRVLGNDVLHDEWREVTAEEVEKAHGYVQRILEDLYDDRPTVEAQLIVKNRLSPPVNSS
ncbi:MAG: DUF4145 domain-containing protein [Patescibacteria group bacterium]|jgi:hypothetical protein